MRAPILVVIAVLVLAAAGVLYFLLAGDGEAADGLSGPVDVPGLPDPPVAEAPESRGSAAPVGAAPFREPRAPAGAAPGAGATAPAAGASGPRHIVSGVILDPVERTPVRGVELRIAFPDGGDPVVLDTTDAAGRFATGRIVPAGPIEIRVRNRYPGIDPREPESEAVLRRLRAGADPTQDLQLDHPYAGAIVIRALDGGTPVAGAEVRIVAAAAASLGITSDFPAGTTGEDGCLRVDGIRPERPVVLSVAGAGRAPASSDPVNPGSSLRPAEVDLTLLRGATIAGAVFAGDGAPAEGISVSAWPRAGRRSALQAKTGAGGRFTIESVPPGSYQVTAQEMVREETAPGQITYSPGESASAEVMVEDGSRAEVELRFGGGLQIEGIVVDTGGNPMSGTHVLCQSAGGSGGLASASSDLQGRFRLRKVAPGRHRLSASAGPFESAEPVDVEAGSHDARLVVPRSKLELLIRVRDAATGEPAAGAEVFVRGGMTMTSTTAGADGTTSLRTPPGAYRVFAGASGRAPEARELEVTVQDEGRKEVEFRLQPGRRITGKVVDAQDRPVSGVQVTVVLDDTKAFRSHLAVSAADGTFTLDGVPAQGAQVGVVKDFLPHPVVPADGAFVLIRMP